jgi:hypothetical protein
MGGPGRLPAPSPLLRWRSRGGEGVGIGGPGLAWGFWTGKGGSWQASRELKRQVFLASKFGGLFLRVDLADFHGKTFWRVILAHSLGGFSWHVYLAGFTGNEISKLLSTGRKRKRNVNQ